MMHNRLWGLASCFFLRCQHPQLTASPASHTYAISIYTRDSQAHTRSALSDRRMTAAAADPHSRHSMTYYCTSRLPPSCYNFHTHARALPRIGQSRAACIRDQSFGKGAATFADICRR